MKKVFVDTDVIVDFTKKKNLILKTLLEQQLRRAVELYINPVVIAEFFTDQKFRRKAFLTKSQRLFTYFTLIDIDTKTGYLTALLLRENQALFLGDALIASTCIINKFELATRNTKHFQKIPHLILYKVE